MPLPHTDDCHVELLILNHNPHLVVQPPQRVRPIAGHRGLIDLLHLVLGEGTDVGILKGHLQVLQAVLVPAPRAEVKGRHLGSVKSSFFHKPNFEFLQLLFFCQQ